MTISEPDFAEIARKILGPFEDPTDPLWRSSLEMAAGQLRQVWNARGAADVSRADALRESVCAILSATGRADAVGQIARLAKAALEQDNEARKVT